MSIFDEDLKLEEDYNYFTSFNNNDSSLENEDFDYDGGISRYLLAVQVVYVIICFVGVCGNSLVLYVVARFSKLKTVTNFYLVNLAIADLVFLIAIPFLVTTMSLGSWPFGNFACKNFYMSNSVSQISSSFFLLVMAADRYLALCHPMAASKWRTPFVAILVAVTAWTLSALIMAPVWLYANTMEIQNRINCNIFWPESSTMLGSTIFIHYAFFLGFCIPFIGITVFSLLVICRLRRFGRSPEGATARNIEETHQKATKLVFTIISVYFICWFPFWVTQISLMYNPQDEPHSHTKLVFFLLAGCLSFANSAINPILYAFLSDSFRNSFFKACPCTIFIRRQKTRNIQDQEQETELNCTGLISHQE